MQITAAIFKGSPNRLRRLMFLSLAALALLAFPKYPVLGGERILTLAMARTDIRAERRIPVNRPARASAEARQEIPPQLAFEAGTAAPSTAQPLLSLRKAVRTASLYPFAVNRRAAANPRNQGFWATAAIEPGFGDLDCDKPARIYGRNGTGWEEPSCGYVKLHLKF